MSEAKIRSLFVELSADLATLNRYLNQLEPQNVTVSRIPPVLKKQEKNIIKVIHPEIEKGTKALKLAGEAFNDLHIQEPYSQKSARRYVGCIAAWPKQDLRNAIIEVVTKINKHKKSIRELVTGQFNLRSERFNVLHAACPGVMTNHLYRQIPLFVNKDIRSIKFSWIRNDISETVNKQELLDELEQHYGESIDEKDAVRKLMNDVARASESDLRVRRPIKVRPKANVVAPSPPSPVSASLPIIILQRTPVEISDPPSFIAAIKRKERKDKQKRKELGTFKGKAIEVIQPVTTLSTKNGDNSVGK